MLLSGSGVAKASSVTLPNIGALWSLVDAVLVDALPLVVAAVAASAWLADATAALNEKRLLVDDERGMPARRGASGTAMD